MTVSVIVPAFNASATIGDTLASLLAQSDRDWEAIVVDDGSNDGTAAMAEEYAVRDARVRVVRQANAGEAGARNTGIQHARHEWILFLDSDDWIAPIFLERMCASLNGDGSLDAVHCGYARVAPDGTHVVDPYQPPAGDMFDTWARRSAFPIHACIVRKSLVDEVGRFDTSFQRSADWDLWQRIARTGARFGAVREVLAFYRMRSGAVSLDATLMLSDGLRVLRQGHAPDPRVRHPALAHANGAPAEQIPSQAFYLLAWCAGLEIGAGRDARPMIDSLHGLRFPQLFAGAVAQTLFDATPLPTASAPDHWPQLWPAIERLVVDFLDALEAQAGAPGLAERTRTRLVAMILRHSPGSRPVIDDYEHALATLTTDRDNWERLAADRAAAIAEGEAALGARDRALVHRDETVQTLERALAARDQVVATQEERLRALELTLAARDDRLRVLETTLAEREAQVRGLDQAIALREQALIDGARSADVARVRIEQLEQLQHALEGQAARLTTEGSQLRDQIARVSGERDTLQHSAEQRAGNLLLNRMRLRRPLRVLANLVARTWHRAVMFRLTLDRLMSGRKHRVLTTVVSDFPVYSQTFVYQELDQLVEKGYNLRLVYSTITSPSQLDPRFRRLWKARRPLVPWRAQHEVDLAHLRRTMPDRVEALLSLLSSASGLSHDALLAHGNVLEAFTFTRMVAAYRPAYLHSYFFYDRSLMALVAGYLLQIPRGVTCYADHMLTDYELKVVPLHITLCDVVVATSARIKRELLALAPGTDPERIIVKPNGIDANLYPVLTRSEPVDGEPFRLVSVCRIEPKKGLIDLVESVALLRDRGVNVQAHIVGTVDEWSEASREYKRVLDHRITELELWGTVHLEGRHGLDGVLRFHGLAQLFIAPFVETESGDKDGIPTALLEAMSTGLAAVATDAGSIVEVIDNGRDGVLVPQRNPAALADAIESLIRDPVRRANLGAEAAATVRHRFDVATCEAVFHARVQHLVGGSKNG